MTDPAIGAEPGRDEERLRATELGALLRQSASGDTTAFGTLYDRTATRFFHLALAVLGDQPGAEDSTRAA